MRMRKEFFRSTTPTNLVKSIHDHKESLAIIIIHSGVQIDYKRAVEIFLELHPPVSILIFDEE